MHDSDGDRRTVRAREVEPGRPPGGADAVLSSPRADERHELPLCGLDVRVIPGSEVSLRVEADADAERVARLERLVEFDMGLACRYGSAVGGRCDPSTDDRLCELSASLGADALRVAEHGLLAPRDAERRPGSG